MYGDSQKSNFPFPTGNIRGTDRKCDNHLGSLGRTYDRKFPQVDLTHYPQG